VAKNPLQFASIQVLIFHAFRTRHTPGKKVMFCARELTAHFPTAAAATPSSPSQALAGDFASSIMLHNGASATLI
jgi:hypothetical protein